MSHASEARSVLQCVLQCVLRCSVLQCVAAEDNLAPSDEEREARSCVAVCVTVWYIALQCVVAEDNLAPSDVKRKARSVLQCALQ